MKLSRGLLALALTFSMSFVSFLALPINVTVAQDSRVALQRGYRTGYSDGYMAGYRDAIDNAAKNYAGHSEYSNANRAYNKDYGSLTDYKDGYKQGFEIGYDTGFGKKSFEATIPADLQPRGEKAVAQSEPSVEVTASPITPVAAPVLPASGVSDSTDGVEKTEPVSERTASTPSNWETMRTVSYQPASDAVVVIPRDTELILELDMRLTTDKNKEGDKFTAHVVSPTELSGAVIEGRIDRIQRPGRIKRRSGMLLSFDRIVLTEERWSNFDAIMTEVLPVKGDNVRRIDGEGTAVGKSTVKDDTIKVGAATGTGAGIGAIAGGPVGAAVGAGIGAAFGVGAVIIERGKDIHLNPNQQLRIKTTYDTRIR